MPVPGGPILAEDHFGLPRPVEPLRTLGRRQYAFWILQQLAPDSAVSNLSIAFRTSRPLRWWPLHAAVNHLLGRHPALRTRFPAAAGVPVRHVSAGSDVQLTVEVGAATAADLTARLHEAAKMPFDLGSELPLRLVLFQISGGGSALLLVVHHIVADAVSVAVLVDELARTYDGIADGSGIPDKLRGEVPAAVEPPARPEDSAFWSEHLRGVEAAQAVLPWARSSPMRATFAGATIISSMAPESVSAITVLRRALGSTENLILLTACYLTLFRHGAGTDLVVGVPVTGRGASAGIGIGFQVSTLPLRVILDPNASFAELIRHVRDVFLVGVQHASVSVEDVLAELGHQSSDWRVPLFRYMYNYRPWEESDMRIAGERPEVLEWLRDESRLDIQLTVIGGRQSPVLVTNYSTEVHVEADIVTLLGRVEALLRAAADDPDRPVGELDMATDAERAVLAAANRTRFDDRPNQTVFEQFMALAESRPAATAVVDDGVTLSYGELAATARGMSARLRADGVRDGDIVALALPRGAAMAAAVLGVWAAGACYLPLDAGQPEQRLTSQVSDAGARLVVVESSGPDPASFGDDVRVVAWPDLVAGTEAWPEAVQSTSGMDSAAYVIYTSGSTGRPRGVVVTHRNLANVVSDFAERLGVTADDTVLWSTTTAFDISGLELFLPLSTGGSVVVAGRESQTRPREVLEAVVKHDVSVAQATPTFWRLAVAEVSGDELRGRTVLCGGEPMSASLARDLLATGCRLFNVYGPTETTIWSTVAEIGDEVADPMSIGGPIANTSVFVTDEHGAELPPGLLGELCIAGTGVSVGYLGCPDLTEERFVPSPKWGRYYRTGDLARWRTDGVLELFGRNDRQVKLRGHRIELSEVEAVLRAHADVADAAVVVVGDPQSDAELRAFVRPVTSAATAGLPDRLWPDMREQLPSYALPSRMMVLADFPVSPNGKVDYAALRSLEVTASTSVSAHPAEDVADVHPDLTQQLLALWRDTLGRPALGERDHFFLNGGHSLLAAQLAGRIADIIGKDVSVRMIFDYPTARQLSARLAGER
jgi:amino acid adenylation domain-containing protein